jgi:hypothetical protein
MEDELIALFEFVSTENGVALASEMHYRLVPPGGMSPHDLEIYRSLALQ